MVRILAALLIAYLVVRTLMVAGAGGRVLLRRGDGEGSGVLGAPGGDGRGPGAAALPPLRGGRVRGELVQAALLLGPRPLRPRPQGGCDHLGPADPRRGDCGVRRPACRPRSGVPRGGAVHLRPGALPARVAAPSGNPLREPPLDGAHLRPRAAAGRGPAGARRPQGASSSGLDSPRGSAPTSATRCPSLSLR